MALATLSVRNQNAILEAIRALDKGDKEGALWFTQITSPATQLQKERGAPAYQYRLTESEKRRTNA